MSNRNRIVWSIAIAWMLPALAWLSPGQPTAVTVVSAAPEPASADSFSTHRKIATHGATKEQLARLELAVNRFEDLGLHLPPLDVRFFDGTDSCDGRKGKFSAGTSPWSIRICSPEIDSLYEHELAHAWEQHSLDDERRTDFMQALDLEEWSNPDVPWHHRGKEWVAVVIQQGLSGLPLPPVLSNDVQTRLRAFEQLTGSMAPVLEDWVKAREVPCDRRPTAMSNETADDAGLICAMT